MVMGKDVKMLLENFITTHKHLFKLYYSNYKFFDIDQLINGIDDGEPTDAWAGVDLLKNKKIIKAFNEKISLELWCYVAVNDSIPYYTLSLKVPKKVVCETISYLTDLIIPYDYKKWNGNETWNKIDRLTIKPEFFRQIVLETCSVNFDNQNLSYDECQEISKDKLKQVQESIQLDKNDSDFYFSYFFTENEAESAFNEFFDDILPNLDKNGLENTERIAEVLSRRGQGLYRRLLMQYWDNKCAVTGCDLPSALRASHAMPWAECTEAKQRINKYNCFLLNANLDALFDKGLVTFDDDGCIKISKTISKENKKALGINENMQLRKKLDTKHLEFLHYHQKHIWVDQEG